MLTKAFIPYKGYYSSPFVRWQGSMANENAIVLGAETSKQWIATKQWDPKMFDYIILGVTVGQPKLFYGGSLGLCPDRRHGQSGTPYQSGMLNIHYRHFSGSYRH